MEQKQFNAEDYPDIIFSNVWTRDDVDDLGNSIYDGENEDWNEDDYVPLTDEEWNELKDHTDFCSNGPTWEDISEIYCDIRNIGKEE